MEKEILNESLIEKNSKGLSYVEPMDVYFIAEPYIPSQELTDKLYDWAHSAGEAVSLQEIDDSRILESVIPPEKLDEVESLILEKIKDPIEEKLKDIKSDIDDFREKVINTPCSAWVKNQLLWFLDDLEEKRPTNAGEYFKQEDEYIFDKMLNPSNN